MPKDKIEYVENWGESVSQKGQVKASKLQGEAPISYQSCEIWWLTGNRAVLDCGEAIQTGRYVPVHGSLVLTGSTPAVDMHNAETRRR